MKIEEAANSLFDSLFAKNVKMSVGFGDVSLYVYCETAEDKDKVPYNWESYNVIRKITGKMYANGAISERSRRKK